MNIDALETRVEMPFNGQQALKTDSNRESLPLIDEVNHGSLFDVKVRLCHINMTLKSFLPNR
jgi:hypothetical protein